MTREQFEQIAVKAFIEQVGNDYAWSAYFSHFEPQGRYGFVIQPPRQKEVALLFLAERATSKLIRQGVQMAVKHCRDARINYN